MPKLAEHLNEFGAWLFDHLVPLSLELAILALLVVLAIRILRIQSSAIRHLFWVLVLIKPIVGFVVSSPISVYSFVFPDTNTVVESAPVNSPQTAEGSVSASTVPGEANSSGASRIRAAHLSPLGLFALAWLAVALFLISRLLVGFGALLYLRRSASVQLEGPLQDALVTASERVGHDRVVRIATSDAVQSPLLTGVLRPLVLFPSQLAARLQQEQLVMILVHELSHLRRFDNLTLLLQRKVQAAFFFHPVVWLCGRMLRREAEQACDDAVIRLTGQSAQYADGLARVAQMARLPMGRSLPMNAFAAAESHLSARIKRLLGDHLGSISSSSRVVGLATLGVLAFFCLPTVSEEKNEGAAVETASTAQGVLSGEQMRAQVLAWSQLDDYYAQKMKAGAYDLFDAELSKRLAQHKTPEGRKFLRQLDLDPVELTSENDMQSADSTLRAAIQRVMVAQYNQTQDAGSSSVYYYAVNKIIFNPAKTNSERFCSLSLQLAFVDGGGSGTLFSTDELKALDGTLEHHEGQIKSVILKTFRTKTIDELEADNIERVFEELHEALDKKLVRNYLRDALDGRRIALKEVFASELIIQ